METISTTIAPETTVAAAAPAERATAPDWYSLMDEAIKDPGELRNAQRFFRQYSLTNRWLASTQLRKAGLPLTPINTFKGWLNVDRAVMKGQKASIALIMPVPVKGKKKDETGAEKDKVLFTKFMLRTYWFHMGQTDGAEYVPPAANDSDWSLASALNEFSVTDTPFEFASVSDMTTARTEGNTISVSPLAVFQDFARLRELCRIVMGHTAEVPSKSVPTDQSLRDMESEAAAYLCAATLNIPGLDDSRGVLQANLAVTALNRIPDRCLHRAFSAADKIINAGFC